MINIEKRLKKWFIIFVPILFLSAALFHVIYDLSGQNIVVGLFSAVNESIWEHCKLVIFPPILLWSLFYIINKKPLSINRNKWFTSALAAVITMIITIPLLFYFYTQALGVEYLWVDIFISFLSVLFGQLIGLHIYKHTKGIDCRIAILILVMIIIVFALLTLYPPKRPIFRDSVTGKYGVS